MVNNTPASAEDIIDVGSIPGSERSPGGSPWGLATQELFSMPGPQTHDSIINLTMALQVI